MPRARAFAFVPFGVDGPEGALACDGLVDGPTIHLSHWGGNRTPVELKADTSVEIALRWNETHDGDGAVVANNHFDTDGALAVWALLEPELARRHARVLVAAAEVGDFDEWPDDERGLRLDAAIGSIAARAGGDAGAYRAVFDAMPSLLDAPDRHEALWQPACDALREADRRARAGALSVTAVGAIAVMAHAAGVDELPGPVLSRLAPPTSTRWLVAFDHGDGTHTYRYERRRWAWADTVVRPVLAPPSRNALAAELGAGWAIKGELGMSGILRSSVPSRLSPTEVAHALHRRDPGAH